ncbi:tripartite tricarboxylate transporter substrate binding protein [Bengtsoniella intestinalis]|uniref:tripartite tricarboxylate transporter substrate binding protein n=1 Tax=Bengtsoniella intestinalis TaxID=3073143 RepID=UPI00391F8511
MKYAKRIAAILSLSLSLVLTGCSSDGSTMTADEISSYPNETIEFIVPAAAGALIDIPTRSVVELLNKSTDSQSVVVNMSGASQITGTAEAFNRGGTGYTVLTCAPAGVMLQPLMVELSYSIEDFRHIALLTPGDVNVVVTNSTSELTTWEALVEKIESGERLTWSASNQGGMGHLAALQVLNELGLEAEFIPFSGSSEGIAALLGDHIDFYVTDRSDAVPRVESGQINALLTLSDTATSDLPDVPAGDDIGVYGMECFIGYYSLAVHKDTPDEVVDYLKTNIDLALQTEEYQAYLDSANFDSVPILTEEEVTDILLSESQELEKIIANLQFTVEE